jgi:HEAT repeat protein
MPVSSEGHSVAVSLCESWKSEGSKILKQLTHDPQWSEAILLSARLLGDASQRQATQFVRAILESNSEYEDVIVALLERLSDANGDVRCAAAGALRSMDARVAREEVFVAFLERLSDTDYYVREAAAKALISLASKLQSQTKSAIIELVLPLARNKQCGAKNDDNREVGYVTLRKLMSAGVSEIGEADGLDNEQPT